MNNSERTRKLLIMHYQQYPHLQIQDVFKYVYQSTFGCAHFLPPLDVIEESIRKELDECTGEGDTPIDVLDGEYSRVPLSYLCSGLNVSTFAKIFVASAQSSACDVEKLEAKLAVARQLVHKKALPFPEAEFEKAIMAWKSDGYPAVHHSKEFCKFYSPHYRVIANKYVQFLPLFAKIDSLTDNKSAVVAIEGGSASGKTTLCEMLRDIYGCTALHMDDFFLRPEQRTKERFAEVGGNVDRERFLEEVLIPLSKGEPINYRRYDCSNGVVLPGIEILPQKLTVVEGAYSMHPEIAGFYDLSVFLDITPELQKSRIEKRNTKELALRFFNEWIPLEKTYFDVMSVKKRCDICFSVSQ